MRGVTHNYATTSLCFFLLWIIHITYYSIVASCFFFNSMSQLQKVSLDVEFNQFNQ